jgi:glycosyltransferase involved in cell wall biosynthesis
VPRSIQRADRILADSESTRRDVLEVYKVPPEKVFVLYSGVDDQFFPVTDPILTRRTLDHYGLGGLPYILSVGTIQPRKNYDRLVEAVQRLHQPDLHLVIAGGKGWLDSPLYARVKELGMKERVHFLGYVPDQDLPVLYSSARIFAFPSLYEGFGLPPLEAMACGAPVVCSNRSSLPEVVGDAGVLVDPYDVDEIAKGLQSALEDERLRNTLINKGQLRVQKFSWVSAARQLLTHYAALVR